MLAEHTRLNEEISVLQSKIKSFPDGKLICVHNGNHFKWFHSDGHTHTYIPKKQREYAEQLAIKKYLTTQLDSCEQEKTAIEYYLRHHSSNTDSPDALLQTVSGNLVRSKSEALIDMALYVHKIPFRYECALNLGGITLYPDFTLRHPQTGEFYYWEHFGLMDDEVYSANTSSKLQLYTSCGIIPGIQLITTYETKEYPLSTETIEKTIDYYFR